MEAILLKEVAEILNLPERDIERESLKTFLEAKLKKLLIEQLQLTRKYGVKNVDEMENLESYLKSITQELLFTESSREKNLISKGLTMEINAQIIKKMGKRNL